jgi:hypothetical protein
VSFARIADAAHALPERCQYIFHIGHVGSTLLSRLMGTHQAILSIREPQVLRTLTEIAQAPPGAFWDAPGFEEHLATILKLLSRSFAADQIPLIKATSYVCELAGPLLSRAAQPRAIFLSVSPRTYLATILGAEHSPNEARHLAPMRAARLHRRLGDGPWDAPDLSIGEIVAMGWACEMSALADAEAEAGARALWLNFDRFLEAPHESLKQAFAHFDIQPLEAEIAAIVAGPNMHRYSKAPEHGYDADLRKAVLDQAHAMAGAEIARGLRWLENLSDRHPVFSNHPV